MATPGRRAERALGEAFEARFAQFHLLQLLRLWLRRPAGEGEGTARRVRFRADLGAGYPTRPASALELLEPAAAAPAALRITTPDFCVGSSLGPLPEPFLEWVRDLERSGQHAMRDFLDLFNHRLNMLRYEVRAEFEPGLNNEAPERSRQALWLAALLGVEGAAQASQIPMPERNWLGMGELLANTRHSAAAARQVLAAQLACPVAIEQLAGAWRPIDAADRHRLGRQRLGQGTLLGSSAWDAQAGVTVKVGPLPYGRLLALLPSQRHSASAALSARAAIQRWREAGASGQAGAATFERLKALLHLVLDRRHHAKVQIAVEPATVPLSRLAARPAGASAAGLRLGLTAWLKSRATGGPSAPLVRFGIAAHDTPQPIGLAASAVPA